MGAGNLILLVLDVALFAALVYYIWKVDQLEESSLRSDIQKIAEKNEREEEERFKEKFERKDKKLEQVRETLEETREELAERKKELADCREELDNLRNERREQADRTKREAYSVPETEVVEPSAGSKESDDEQEDRETGSDRYAADEEQPDQTSDAVPPEPDETRRLLDQGLLPTWKLISNHPTYENLRQVFNVYKAPNKFQVAPFSPGEEILGVMEDAGAEALVGQIRTLSDLRSDLEDVLSETLFSFYEGLSVKGKTITQLERNKEANEDAFWTWFLKEKLDVQLSEPDFMQEHDFQFQPFLDHLIDHRRGNETRKTEYVNALFEKTVQALREASGEDRPLVRLSDNLSPLTRALDRLQEGTEKIRNDLPSRVEAALDDPSLDEEGLDRQNLLREFRETA